VRTLENDSNTPSGLLKTARSDRFQSTNALLALKRGVVFFRGGYTNPFSPRVSSHFAATASGSAELANVGFSSIAANKMMRIGPWKSYALC